MRSGHLVTHMQGRVTTPGCTIEWPSWDWKRPSAITSVCQSDTLHSLVGGIAVASQAVVNERLSYRDRWCAARRAGILVAALLGGLLSLTAACSTGRPVRPAPPGERYEITAEELNRTNQSNLFDAIRIARPFWFARTGRMTSSSGAEIMVYLQDQPLGGVSQLLRVPIHSAATVRYLTATEAQVRYGQNNGARPAIVIETPRH